MVQVHHDESSGGRGALSSSGPGSFIIWLFIILVGLGSFLFHSTLSIAGQVLDELPICLLLITATCISTPMNRWNPALRAEFFSTTFFLCTIPALTVLCLLYPVVSHIVCILSLPTSTCTFLHLYFAMPVAARPVKVVRSTMCILLVSVASWVVDRGACKREGKHTPPTILIHTLFFLHTPFVCTHPIHTHTHTHTHTYTSHKCLTHTPHTRSASYTPHTSSYGKVWCSEVRAWLGFNPHLHAVWHIGMAALVWGVILIGYTCRLYGDGKPSRIVRGGVGGLVPYVTLQV